MTIRLASKALWFAFVAFVTCPAVWAVPDHIIEVSVQSILNNRSVRYKHLKGRGIFGFIGIKGNQEVQWSCKSGDACGQITINLDNSGLVCTNSPGAPSSTPTSLVTCDVDSTKINNACQKWPLGGQCYVYTTTVYTADNPPITDDPEFIVDSIELNGSRNTFQTGAFILLALLLGVYGGYRWGKAQAHKPPQV